MKAVLALLFALCVTASWVQLENAVKLAPSGAPTGWKFIGEPLPDRLHRSTIVLKGEPEKRADLERVFWEVSDPKHANYGKHLKFDQLVDFLGAPQAQIDLVVDWLRAGGVTDLKVNVHKDSINVAAPVRVLESLLNTEFGLFVRLSDEVEFTRIVKNYYVPAQIAEVVSIVSNLGDFPHFAGSPRKIEASAVGQWDNYCGTSCAGKITPQVIQMQYNFTASTPVHPSNSFAVAEFQSQHYDQADLDNFSKACGYTKSIAVNDKNGGNNPGACNLGLCVEALLDLEYIAGVGGLDIPLSDYWFNTYSLLDWVQAVIADPKASLVHSVSYGNDEAQQTSTAYMQQCNTQFQAAGALGLSLLFASGDQGVWGREGHNGHFNPDFPAGSPYITAVGGSDFAAPTIHSPEVCCADSGGGFSITFPRPSYQDAQVTGYLGSGVTLPTASNYNASGRAYPDISAIFGLYIPYCISTSTKFEGVAGTSASSPVVASLFANLNNVRLLAGKSPLGFLNPWIYSTQAAHPDAFFDVTQGVNNAGSGQGFSAFRGWDPCSGVGTPNYVNMVKYV